MPKIRVCRACKIKNKLPLPNSSSYEAKELEKPSSKVSMFKLENFIKRCL